MTNRICSTCGQNSTKEDQYFCTKDGTKLVEIVPQHERQVDMHSTPQPQHRIEHNF